MPAGLHAADLGIIVNNVSTIAAIADWLDNGIPYINRLGMATGFLFALFALGGVREILGEGCLFGISLFGPDFEPWVIMILPPGGFLTLGLLLLFFSWVQERKERLAAQLAASAGDLS